MVLASTGSGVAEGEEPGENRFMPPSSHLFLGIDVCNIWWKFVWFQLTKSRVGRGGIFKTLARTAEEFSYSGASPDTTGAVVLHVTLP